MDPYDETMEGKTYDRSLIRRLIAYAKPYRITLIIVALFMIFSTFLDLLRPYVLKVAIDDHINGIYKPLAFSDTIPDTSFVELQGRYYTRATNPDQSPKAYAHIREAQEGFVLQTIDGDRITQEIVLTPEQFESFRFDDRKGIWTLGGLFFLALISQFVFDYLQVLWLNRTSQNIIFEIRKNTFSHIIGQALRFFDRQVTGRLVTRVTNDTENLNEMYTSVLLNLIKDILILVGVVVMLFSLDTRLALLSLSLTPFILFAAIFFRKKIRKNYRASRAQLSALNGYLAENISGMMTTQVFHKEEKVFSRFYALNQTYLTISREEVLLFSIFRPSVEMIRSLGIALLIWFGGGFVQGGMLEFGILYAFIDYLQRFFEPILDLTEQYNILQSAMASSERIFEVLDTDETIRETGHPKSLKKIRGRIAFENVWFAYEKENWVLKDVSFVVEPGQTLALVGATGAGKTSIIHLLTRFYEIQRGRITIDGVDIRDLDLHDLRSEIGIVLQDVFLFSGTIADNIRIGNPEASDAQVRRVSEYVNADPFIRKLPQGYEEPVMERGVTLSTGERQLLAFARTLLTDPAILILDEATSSIDTHSELSIQDALHKLTQNRTTIAIAHRLSTIQNADVILVLSHGEIVERGKHAELLEAGGLYSILHRLQMQNI